VDILWIIIFILYMAYRAFSESQKKQARAQRRRVVTTEDPGTRHYRYEEVKPHQEVPWDFDPDQYKQETVKSYEVKLEEVQPANEMNRYQKQLHKVGYRGEDKSKRKADKLEKASIEDREESSSNGWNFDLDSRSLVNAVIMSEVLQPPRSKRPIR